MPRSSRISFGQDQLGKHYGCWVRCVEYRNTADEGGVEVDLVGADAEAADSHELGAAAKISSVRLVREDADEVGFGDAFLSWSGGSGALWNSMLVAAAFEADGGGCTPSSNRMRILLFVEGVLGPLAAYFSVVDLKGSIPGFVGLPEKDHNVCYHNGLFSAFLEFAWALGMPDWGLCFRCVQSSLRAGQSGEERVSKTP